MLAKLTWKGVWEALLALVGLDHQIAISVEELHANVMTRLQGGGL